MKRNLTTLAAFLLASALLCSPLAVSANARSKGQGNPYKVSIHFSAKKELLYGKLTGPKSSCVAERPAVVRFDDGDGFEDWSPVSTSSAVVPGVKPGKWKAYGAMGGIQEGKYYIHVVKGSKCPSVKSKTIKVG